MSEKLQQDNFKVAAKQKEETEQYLLGRGAQFNTKNRFLKDEKTREHIEALMIGAKKMFQLNTSSRNQKL
jgi:hypothetical protein